MRTEDEIRKRFYFCKGNKSGLQYPRSEAGQSFRDEIKEMETQISVLKWVLEEECQK